MTATSEHPQVDIVASRAVPEPLADDLRVLPATDGEWVTLLDLIPGYDPFATAGAGDYFDGEIATKALRFFHEFQTHIEGKVARQPFILERWQQSVIANLFGWQSDDGTVREALGAIHGADDATGQGPQLDERMDARRAVRRGDGAAGAADSCAHSGEKSTTLA